ncbi:MAG: aminotransferase class I/II-fold pyridoxal phosphate-dependent enzyme [Acidimicrobiales bacterium]
MTRPTRSWAERLAARQDTIDAAGRRRSIRDLDAVGPAGTLDGRPVVSFASNDYLGLATHPAVRAAAADAARTHGVGAGASRLVVGARPAHRALEAALASWKGTEAALLLPTGYAANLGVLTSLADADTVIYSDALNHASIVDGTRLARARVEIVTHADLDALAQALAAHPPERAALVVTDTVFSMDGDVADVAALATLCRDAGALLVLDEAHAVLGPELPESLRHAPDIVRVGTLSKTLGAIGGFVAASSQIVDLLVNTAAVLFTTAPSLPDTAAAHAALDIVRGDEGTALVGRLRAAVDRFVPGHPSPILPVVIGDEAARWRRRSRCSTEGCLVPAIRPPPWRPARRACASPSSAAHTDEQLAQLTRPRRPSARLPPRSERRRDRRRREPRPNRLVLVAGTGTEVGRRSWRRRWRAGSGLTAAPWRRRKPAQSFDPADRADRRRV